MFLRSAIRPSLFSHSPLSKSISTSIPQARIRAQARPQSALLKRPILVAFGLSLSIPFLQPRPITRLDTSPYSPQPSSSQAAPFSSSSSASYTHSRDAKTPLTKDGKTLNPAAVKQISLGAILGLGAGVLLSAFSRSLTLVLGLGIVVWQYAARKGYNFIPVDRLQRNVKNVNLRSAINDNVAFKISFGLMFALSAFGEF
ncbi:hypothetical protein A1O1_07333 [Capronia coronata CBS 617.96]|uniref:FUN14 domain-containing protein n=1 Tax=Capronia coronata CBS 617.96 TaxID=1182541 RepID=W9YN63_9EURO|nr:uncharacterized protein A1O1_07333 [Capronia coronata CBS 617.96]EXJ83709.1 hypothetical protein A1O1_07333 [Capronia coronata CBS 617.96]